MIWAERQRSLLSGGAAFGAAVQNGLQFPVEVLSGKHIPESALGMGRTFRTGPRRKARPGIGARNGMRFPDGAPSGNCDPEFALRMGCRFRLEPSAEATARNLAPDWGAVSQQSGARKLRP
mgnify:CR=1 FL=1